MKTLDEMLTDKILELVKLALSKIIKADFNFDKVTDITEEQVKMLKEKRGIEGVIIDVDETLRKEMNQIPEVNQKWINSIRNQLKIVILTNGRDGKIEDYFKKKGIDYIYFAHKPLKKNFLKACEKMNLNPENVLVIGDEPWQDIHGGKKNHMKTALIKNVEEDER